jgi:hypothetical protein
MSAAGKKTNHTRASRIACSFLMDVHLLPVALDVAEDEEQHNDE